MSGFLASSIRSLLQLALARLDGAQLAIPLTRSQFICAQPIKELLQQPATRPQR